MNKDMPILSVCLITYNQKEYITKALDEVFKQKVNFSWELVIGDDLSNDGTTVLIEEVIKNAPCTVTYIKRSVNLGMSQNWIKTILACKGRYIALLEGDDFWTDHDKLQKQVDFLEKNNEYGLVTTRYQELENENEDKLTELSVFDTLFENNQEFYEVSIENMFNPYALKTLTAVFRSSFVFDKNDIVKLSYFKDIFLFSLILSHSKGAVLNFVSGVYRIHEGGIWSLRSEFENIKSNYLTIFSMNKFFKGKYNSIKHFSFSSEEALVRAFKKEKKLSFYDFKFYYTIKYRIILRKVVLRILNLHS